MLVPAATRKFCKSGFGRVFNLAVKTSEQLTPMTKARQFGFLILKCFPVGSEWHCQSLPSGN